MCAHASGCELVSMFFSVVGKGRGSEEWVASVAVTKQCRCTALTWKSNESSVDRIMLRYGEEDPVRAGTTD